jgi:8-oxo-dGTP pyrophosphatase MutT (NUDIX family)
MEPQPMTFPASLAPYHVSREDYFKQNPQYQALAVGTLVFHNNGQEDRILLVQRASTERAWPLMWETPGGSCDAEDPSVLHGAARELKEEAGLKCLRFNRLVGPGDGLIHEFKTGQERPSGKAWCKVSFDVDVENPDIPGTVATEEKDIRVQLDPKEHQEWKWVTKKEIEEDQAGEATLRWISQDQKRVILHGFELRARAAQAKNTTGDV